MGVHGAEEVLGQALVGGEAASEEGGLVGTEFGPGNHPGLHSAESGRGLDGRSGGNGPGHLRADGNTSQEAVCAEGVGGDAAPAQPGEPALPPREAGGGAAPAGRQGRTAKPGGRSRPWLRPSSAHRAVAYPQFPGQTPPGEPGGLPEAVQPVGEVLGEMLRLDVVDVLLAASHALTPLALRVGVAVPPGLTLIAWPRRKPESRPPTTRASVPSPLHRASVPPAGRLSGSVGGHSVSYGSWSHRLISA